MPQADSRVQPTETGSSMSDPPVRPAVVWQPVRNSLADALVRACVVEVVAVQTENESKMLLADDDHVIEELGADAAQEPFAHGVRVRRAYRCADDFDSDNDDGVGRRSTPVASCDWHQNRLHTG